MARTVAYYFSLGSSWAFVGNDAFHEAMRRQGVTIDYKPVGLIELFAQTGGLPRDKRHPSRQAHRIMELQRWRDRRGLSFSLIPRHFAFDARLADGVVLAILERGDDPARFLQGAFAAIWEAERNLAEPAVLTELAEKAGLPGPQLVARAASPEIAARYAATQQQALAAGVFGSPSYVLDGEVFWGQDRIEFLVEALTSGRPPFRGTV